ncbi:MurR/RpiR family transcriptional regulator [Poseidonocella sp. HB161398]|uniref:MurR/RpiR family transcriptional regulator n=1 Tax=Poseidonocella sp. HB161398 TaxID=2320855 RepID=UPI001107CC3F|nr:MurR/RpiR family transcriptional regulator [Poseidonocella sp. HB161398]
MDPTLKNRVISELKAVIPELPRGLRTVAKYVVDHPSDFGLDSIRETARKAGVSTYTLVRLAERMGFSGYDEMRDPFRHALVSTAAGLEQPQWVERLEEAGALGRVQAEASVNAMAIVQRSLERQGAAQMQRVADLLIGARSVYLTAVRASYGMAYYLHYVGQMALPSLQLVPRHMNSAIDELHQAGEGDVLIAIMVTPYSRETIEACRFARRKGMKLVLIADSEIVSPDLQADETLVAAVISTYHFGCYAGLVAVIEMLLALLVERGGEAARARIRSYEELRRDTQAYWSAGKPR